jgi:hypothetical protein
MKNTQTMKNLSTTLLAMGILAFGPRVQATIYFSDNFNSDNGGAPFLNFGTPNQDGNGNAGTLNPVFPNWTVTSGSVDLIGYTGVGTYSGWSAPDYDFLPGNGLYIDLDGTTGQDGTITSKGIALAAGNYQLSFSLANSQRDQADSTAVSVTVGLASQIFDTPDEPEEVIGFQTETMNFTVPSGGETVNLVFADTTVPGDDDVGALLDNVVVSSNGAPNPGAPDGGSTAMLTGMALIGLGALRRKLK